MKQKVLLVDDDLDVIEILQEVLEQSFEVVSAHNGVEGLRKFEQGVFDFVVTDVRMPQMNGVEMAKSIRLHSQVPILFITASQDEYITAIQEITQSHLIKKPFAFCDIQKKIQELQQNCCKEGEEVA